MSDLSFVIPIRVYIEDTDAGGIVYYVNYLKFMERARTEFMREQGFAKPAIIEDGKLMVVHSADVKYHKPARLDDELMATTSISKLARTYVIFQQQIFRDGELLCSALIKVACVTSDSIKPVALPAVMRQSLLDKTS